MHPKITNVTLYLRNKGPYVAVHRGKGSCRFHPLTGASAGRLARVTRRMNGSHLVFGLGWAWRRRR